MFLCCSVGIWTVFEEADILWKVLLLAYVSVWQLYCTTSVWFLPGAEQPQNCTLWSHKRDVNLVFLVPLLGTVLCDDCTGHNETSALLLLNSMCLGATQFSVYLPPNNCLLCVLKRLLTFSSLHPRKYSSYRWFLPFCSHGCSGKVTRKSVEILSMFWD